MEELTNSLSLPRASLRLYNTVYTFNFKTQEYKEIKSVEYFVQATKHIKSARELIVAFIQYCLVPEDRLRAYRFLELATLRDRLDGQQFITQDFCSIRSGWIRVYVIPTEIDESGVISDAMLCTQNVFVSTADTEGICKQTPLQSFEEQGTLSQITKTLYGFNLTIDLERGTYRTIVGTGMGRTVQIFLNHVEYTSALAAFCANLHAAYYERLNELIGLENLRKQERFGFIGCVDCPVRYPEAGQYEWHELNAFLEKDASGKRIANILVKDVTRAHLITEQKEQAIKAAAEKDRLLSSITKILYKFNVTVNLKTWKYSFILGEATSPALAALEGMDDYNQSYPLLCQVVRPEQRIELDALVSKEALVSVADRRGYIGRVTSQTNVQGRQGWHDTYLFISTDARGNPVANILVQDVTETQRLREEQSQLAIAKAASEAKTSFLFNMSHDIRTPMNAIMGFTNLLDKYQEQPERRQDYLGKIRQSSNILLSIINNVLEMSRIEKGTLVLNEAAWDASDFNDTLFAVFHDMMRQKNIAFKRMVNVQHQYVFCDPIKLREVFINILSNAYKYTNEGGSVTMRLTEIPAAEEGYALFRTVISDTGIGMAPDFLPHLFEEFSREHTSTENKVEGTGLGMPIVKRLLALMKGTIEVESTQGVGTTFTITVPHRIARKEDVEVSVSCDLEGVSFEGRRLLLTEDNELNAEIATEILQEVGFEVDHAGDGLECLQMLQDKPAGHYDLILMDIQMPRLNGYEATERIRALPDSSRAGIPIIAMTANAFEEDKQEAVNRGMNAHLAKPINVPDLLTMLSTVLNSRLSITL